MNIDYLMAVAGSLITDGEISLRPTESAYAASLLLNAAVQFCAGALDAMAKPICLFGIRRNVVNQREVINEPANADAAINEIRSAQKLASGASTSR